MSTFHDCLNLVAEHHMGMVTQKISLLSILNTSFMKNITKYTFLIVNAVLYVVALRVADEVNCSYFSAPQESPPPFCTAEVVS